MTELVHLERRDDGVALVTLDSPKVNALSSELLGQLGAIAGQLTENPPGAVVITGGPKIFAAGADITEFGGPDEAATVGRAFTDALNAVAGIPRTVIASVAGVALGGGCELALACDLRICGENSKFGQPEILLGIIPGGGGTQRLARLVGASRAKDMILTGRQVSAAEALGMGLVNRVVAPDEVLDTALELASGLAQGPVLAHAMAKAAIDSGLEGSLADGIQVEQGLFAEVFATDDASVGVSSFLEHGPGKAAFNGS